MPYGKTKATKANFVRLWWDCEPIGLGLGASDSSTKLKLSVSQLVPDRAQHEKGIYVFEGCHDARPDGGILYIGQVGAKGGRTFKKRIAESTDRFIWHDKETWGIYSDVWNLTVRWATVEQGILDVEHLLIVAHAPAFNMKKVRSPLRDTARTLVVLNGGAKGRLLPSVCGHYYDSKFWP